MEPDDDAADHIHTFPRCSCRPTRRRHHKKSRNGCQNCKRRRIKCDEAKPVCGNCAHCYIVCDYSRPLTADGTRSDAPLLLVSAPALLQGCGPRKRGRPLKYNSNNIFVPPASHAVPALPATASSTPPSQLHLVTPSLPSPSSPLSSPFPPTAISDDGGSFSALDFRLFHHYLSSTAGATFGNNDAFWRDRVPSLAWEHPFVLRLLLALAGQHIACSNSNSTPSSNDNDNQCRRRAAVHFEAALPHVTALLPSIHQDNCAALYAAAVLVCNYSFAAEKRKGHLLVVADGAEVTWWQLFRGVRFVLETMGLEAIFAGLPPPSGAGQKEVEEGKQRTKNDEQGSNKDSGYIPWEEPLATLRLRIEREHADLLSVTDGLIDCFHQVYGTHDQATANSRDKMHIVMRWLWFIEDDFVAHVVNNAPAALALLAHFSVLLQTLESFWFMMDWADRVLAGAVERLDPSHQDWITWPREQLKNKTMND